MAKLKEPRQIGKAWVKLQFYQLLAVWLWASHFIALWLSFHIWEMAIVIPTSQNNCDIKEIICALKHIIMHCIKTND
jgi:hypothetical protein